MREPYFREDPDQRAACLEYFGPDRSAISFLKVAKFIRDNCFENVSAEGVVWYWHKRYLIVHHQAAFEVVKQLLPCNGETYPPTPMPHKGMRPDDAQILKAMWSVRRVLPASFAEDEEMLREVTAAAWESGYDETELADMKALVDRRHTQLDNDLHNLTYEEVLDVWDYCRKELLPPFPPPWGSTL
ncbi:MAG: hypothetical protein DI585_00365 [Pseudomonas fluorescens]|nr:MAG: hypothetical protein DI585_00365 [Pseudomonas fluorescens]